METRRLLEKERRQGPPLWEAAWARAVALAESVFVEPDPAYYWPRWSEGTAGLALLLYALALNSGAPADAERDQADDAVARVELEDLVQAAAAITVKNIASRDALDQLVERTRAATVEPARAVWMLLREDCTPPPEIYELASFDPLQRFGFDHLVSIGYVLDRVSERHTA